LKERKKMKDNEGKGNKRSSKEEQEKEART